VGVGVGAELRTCSPTGDDRSMPTFHVWYKWPSGWVYELWPSADDEASAVLSADHVLEYVERIGIRDYLNPDGVTARPPAEFIGHPRQGGASRERQCSDYVSGGSREREVDRTLYAAWCAPA
jgi:hypothetical protein